MIVPFTETCVEDAAALVARRYRDLRAQVPTMLERYEDPAGYESLLDDLVGQQPGVVLLDGGRLAGFLIGMILPNFRGRRSVYSPEWGNAAADGQTYHRLYKAMAKAWVADRCMAHYVTVFAHDRAGIDAWFWQSFGLLGVDAMRDLSRVRIDGDHTQFDLARATLDDFAAYFRLKTELRTYIQSAPIFVINDHPVDRAFWKKYLQAEENCVILARHNGNPVAFIQIGPANMNVCTVIRDPKTASITGAFTEEPYRSQGVAALVLDKALEWARSQGYTRCAVDFESMNRLGSRFWLRHFHAVCYSMQRVIDDRATADPR